MTVAELIEQLRQLPQDADVYVMTGYDCDEPSPPEPVHNDRFGTSPPGVYL